MEKYKTDVSSTTCWRIKIHINNEKKKIKKNQAEEERREKKIAIAAELLSESEECE